MARRKPRARKQTKKQNPFVSALVFVAFFIVLNIILIAPGVILYTYDYMSYNSLNFVSDAALSMSFSLSVMCYFIFYKKQNFTDILSAVGLGNGKFNFNVILVGVILFAALFVMEIIVSVISYITNVPINSNVDILLASAPLWFYVFTAIMSPINEEILFRGFMVPRLGIVISSLFFAAGHFAYNSSFEIEVIAALLFGLLAGYAYKRTNSLYPSIIGHMLLNAVTLIVTFMVIL